MSVQVVRECTPGEVAELLLRVTQHVNVEVAPVAAALAALASGVFGILASWAVRVTQRPTNILVSDRDARLPGLSS